MAGAYTLRWELDAPEPSRPASRDATPLAEPLRRQFEVVKFADGVNEIEDLTPDMRLQGVVTNVTHFGAFVDVGVHQDGLVHVSELDRGFVRDPSAVYSAMTSLETQTESLAILADSLGFQIAIKPGE